MDESQEPRDAAWAHTIKNSVVLRDRNSGLWLVRALAPAESTRQKTVSAYPNRRRFPLKLQNHTALFLQYSVPILKSTLFEFLDHDVLMFSLRLNLNINLDRM